jgi:ABC-type nitrate/sulfonate/bicarbonate transport system permease component
VSGRARGAKQGRASRRAALIALEIAGPLLLLGAWQIWTVRAASPFWPPIDEIGRAFDREWLSAAAWQHLLPSLGRLLAGYAMGVTVGIGAGLVIGASRLVAQLVDPIVHFFRALPAPVLVPFAILVFGVGDEMKVALIAVAVLWPVLLNTVDGVRGADPVLLDTARAHQIPAGARLRLVVLPWALPSIFAGLRTSLAIALALMIISEMVASTNGIGYTVVEAQRTFAIPEMWAGLLVVGLFGNLATIAFTRVERRVLRWHRGLRERERDEP